MNLYDTPADVVRKAMVGLAHTPLTICEMTGIEPRALSGFLSGDFSDEIALRLAPALGLDTDSLRQLPKYDPKISLPEGLERITLPFEDEEVNVWLLESGSTRVAIDCGFRPNDFSDLLEERNFRPCHLLITHAHRDHIGGLGAAAPGLAAIYAPAGVSATHTLRPEESFSIGPFHIRTIDLTGHFPLAIGYVLDGPGMRVVAAGDSVFAGSIGGCPDSSAFGRARSTIIAGYSSLEDDRIILTGHGPATNLAHERASNPFLAAWFS